MKHTFPIADVTPCGREFIVDGTAYRTTSVDEQAGTISGERVDDELRRLRQLERVVLNQLGTTDPKQVAAWIVRQRRDGGDGTMTPRAQAERCTPETFGYVGRCAMVEGDPSYVARCAPQADGASEQDVIGLLRDYTDRVSEGASRGAHSAPGSDSLTSEPPARTCVETLDYLDTVVADVESRGSC